MGTVKIYCDCGKQVYKKIPEWMKAMSLIHFERMAVCPACAKRKKIERRSERRREQDANSRSLG